MENKMTDKQLEEALTFTNFFLDTYVSAYYVDMESLACKVFKRSEQLERDYPIVSAYTDSLTDYINRDVHPDDRAELLSMVQPAFMREQLKKKKHFTHLFRDISGGKEKLYRLQVIQGAEERFAAFGFIDISEEIEEQNQRTNEAMESKKLIDGFAASYNVAYVVNMKTDAFRQLRMDDFILGKDEHFDRFTEAKEFFFGVLHPMDRARLEKELEYDTIREKLKKTRTYNVEYRAMIKGSSVWHEMNITSIDEDEIAVGFAERDLEITKRRLEEKRYDEYLALFVIDIDTETIKPMKISPLFQTADVGQAVPYGPAMKQFAASYNEGETRDFFESLSDLAFVKTELTRDDKRTYSFRSTRFAEEKWIDVTSYVILRHDDGTPATFTLGFSVVDALATVRRELQERLKENMEMIRGLAGSYHALYYFNISQDTFKVYSLDAEKFPEAAQIVNSGLPPVEVFRRFGMSEMVHPDDRQLFADLSIETIREKLAHTKKMTYRFRRLFKEGYLWTEMDWIKYEEVDEPANIIALGFAERDLEIRTEMALTQCFNILGKEIQPKEAIDELLTMVGEFYSAERCYVFEFEEKRRFINNTFEWCAKGIAPMISHLQGVPMDEVDGWVREFKKNGAFYMSSLDNGNAYNSVEGRELLEMQGISSLIAAPMMNGDEVVGFIGVDNPAMAMGNLRLLKTMAVIVYSELLKRKQAQMALYESSKVFSEAFLDSYASANYVDLTEGTQVMFRRPGSNDTSYGYLDNYLEAMNKYIRESVHPEDQERMYEAMRPDYIRARLKKEKSYNLYIRDISSGKTIWYRVDVTRGSDEEHIGLGFTDVTEKLAEETAKAEELKRALAAADSASQSKTTFLFNMSHDIRTPMNAIMGFTAMAKKHADDRTKTLEYLDKIDISGQQLLTLINQVLEMARIESGKIEIEEKPTNVREEFDSMVTVLAEQAAAGGLVFRQALLDVKHNYILADNARVGSITLNIAGNAMKYTPQGGTVEFILQELPARKEGYATFRFTMKDTGIGMSEEFQKSIYEPFAREKNSTVSRIQGTGLGMSIVKNLVDLMGGDIAVESQVGKGTRFDILLDFKIDEPTEKAVTSGESQSAACLSGRRILLVEDNEMNREIAKDILEEHHFLVEEAEDGAVAVEKIREAFESGKTSYYDLILMDIQMPKMNGYEATRAIRELENPLGIHLPIVAMTANAFEEDRQNAFNAGMDEHLPKPINIPKLLQTLNSLLRNNG